MICYRCGRELPDKSPYCKGCGTQLRRRRRIRSDSLGNILRNEITLGSRSVSTWKIMLALAGMCSLLVLGLYLVPPIIDSIDFSGIREPAVEDTTDEYDPGSTIAAVTGNIIRCTTPLPDLEITDEKAYADGSWQKNCVMYESVNLRFIRRPAAESWINTHIFQLFPDVMQVDQFAESLDVSGYTSNRIQFASEKASGCVIEAMCVSDGSFDYMFIMEMPYDMFQEYYIYAEEWFNHLILVDAQSGIESFNPAKVVSAETVEAITVNP